MRFLAGENIPLVRITSLRGNGHDVVAVRESMRGAAEVAVLVRARSAYRLWARYVELNPRPSQCDR